MNLPATAVDDTGDGQERVKKFSVCLSRWSRAKRKKKIRCLVGLSVKLYLVKLYTKTLAEVLIFLSRVNADRQPPSLSTYSLAKPGPHPGVVTRGSVGIKHKCNPFDVWCRKIGIEEISETVDRTVNFPIL